jgi:hypothetical protein
MAQQRRSRAHWRHWVDGGLRSGLTQERSCERHGISLASLRRWRSMFQSERDAGSMGQHEQPRRVPVHLIDHEAQPPQPLTLVLDDGLRLEVTPGFDEPTLTRLLGLSRAAA